MKRLVVTPGERYARLTVVREVDPRGRYRFIEVSCDCGNTKVVGLNDVRSGRTTSCGCYRTERTRETHLTHGMSRTPEYQAWWDMVARCTDESHPAYADYGGRGITVCDEWCSDPTGFIEHIGQKPFRSAQLDRIDNDSGYFPGNVRWTTHQENRDNRRNTKRWIIDGVEYKTLRIASALLGVSESTLKQWCKGWKCYRTGKTYPPKDGCCVRSKRES